MFVTPVFIDSALLSLPLFLIALTSNQVHAKRNDDLVSEFTKKTGPTLFLVDHKKFCLLLESKASDDYDDFYEEFLESAQKFENKVKFIYINTDIEENWQMIEYLGLIAEDIPAILFIDLQNGLTKYKADFNEITRKNINKFTRDCLNDDVEPFIKGDEVPSDWNKKLVKELVSETFNEFVLNKQRTTFVVFYAPWCQACKNIMPELEKLAEHYKNNEQVMIAKMNAVSNEVIHLPVLDVPTIALFVDGNIKPIYYDADTRSMDAFVEFINQHIEKSTKKSDTDKNSKRRDSEQTKKSDTDKKSEQKDSEQTKKKKKMKKTEL